MPAQVLEGKPLVNIVRAEIITEETSPKTFRWETASKATIKPKVSTGEEKILRIKNKIVAKNETEDIVIGYDLEFEDNTMNPEIFALIDGGTIEYDSEEPAKAVQYNAPVAGQTVTRTKFTLNVYTEEKDGDGSTVSYAKFNYKHCKGKPAEYNIEDGNFMVPKLIMASSPKIGESPVTIDFLEELPA